MAGVLLRSLKRVIGRRDTVEPELRPEAERRQSERRREPRFQIAALRSDGDRVAIMIEGSRELLQVFDLSTRGLSFESRSTTHAVPLGTLLRADIYFGSAQIPVGLKVVNRRDTHLGCVLESPPAEWHAEVARYLDPLQLGKQLREIDAAYVKQEEGGPRMRWFQGGPACDLYVWTSPAGHVVQFQLFMMWQLLEWSHDKGLRTGEVDAPPDEERSGYRAAALYKLRAPPSTEIVTLARRVLNAGDVPAQLLALLEAATPP